MSVMGKGRLEAFSDGVIAIIITIMVLEMKVPQGESAAVLRPLLPVFLSYVLSFLYVGIYWNNHHHMLHATTRVTGPILWANLHLLFWLSLFPFATGWMGQNHFGLPPTALYGFVLLMAGIAYFILQHAIIASQGPGYLRLRRGSLAHSRSAHLACPAADGWWAIDRASRKIRGPYTPVFACASFDVPFSRFFPHILTRTCNLSAAES